MAEGKLKRNAPGYKAVHKITRALETKPGNIPGSRRVQAGPRLSHAQHLVVPGNRPGSRRYLGNISAGVDWRDDLIEAIVEGIITGTIKAPYKIAAMATGADLAQSLVKGTLNNTFKRQS